METVVLPLRVCTRFGLPPVCILTGETEDVVWKSVNFRARAASPLVPVDLPFTEAAFQRWTGGHRKWPAVAFLGYFALIVFGVVGRFYLHTTWKIDVAPIVVTLVLMGASAPVVVLVVRRIRQSGPILVALDEAHMTLRIPSARAAAAFREAVAGAVAASAPVVVPGEARCQSHGVGASFLCARCGSFGCPVCLGEKPEEPFLCEECRVRRVAEQVELERLVQQRGSRQAIVFMALGFALMGAVLLLVLFLR